LSIKSNGWSFFMNLITRSCALVFLAGALTLAAQESPKPQPVQPSAKPPAGQTDTPATQPATPAKPDASVATKPDAAKQPDRSAAYYHYALAHMYEELVAMYGRSEYASKAIDEYRLAIEADPKSPYLNSGLAELYAKTGRIRDAVVEAQDILKKDPTNIDARRLLGRIYLRSLGDLQSGTQSQNVLKLAIEQYEQIVKLDPKSVEDLLLLGRLYRLNNELLKAEQQFKKAVEIQPDSEEAVTMLAYLYNEEGDSARAQQVLTAVPEGRRSAKLFSALGLTYEQQKDYKKAIDAYKKAMELDRDNLDAVRGLAQNLMNDNQTEAALEQYQAIVEADPQDAQTYLRIAEIYRRDGKFDQALTSLKKAETILPDSQEIPYSIAVIYEAQGKYDEAVQLLQQLIQKSEKPSGEYTASEKNNRSVFIERLGSTYREQNKTQLSVDTFRKLIPMGDETATRAYQQIIETYRDAKMWPEATAAAKEGSEKFPNDRDLKTVYAAQLADMGQAEKGLQMVNAQITGKNPTEDRQAYLTLAQMYSRLKRWKDAEDAIMQADKLSTKPEDKDYTSFVAGSIYERQKKYDQAEEMFRKVLASDPKNAMALNYLGYMLADRGTRLDEALGLIRRAVALDPQSGAYLDSLGWAYFKMGNYEQAEENLRKAIERTSNDPTVHDHLGDLYQKTGRLKQAVTQYERSLAEWNKTITAEQEPDEMAKLQKKLDSAKVKLANMQKQ
jgi:tetratricopeptide (TPR) repeat protein